MKTFSLYKPLLVRKFRISIIVTLFVLFTATTFAQTCSSCPPMSLSINSNVATTKKYITFDKTINDSTTLKQVLNLPNAVIHRFGELSILNALGDILTTNLSEDNWAIVEDVDIQNNDLTNHPLIHSEIPVYITNDNKELVITHLVYVKLIDSTDFQLLENIAANNNIEILGRNKFMPLWYTLSCNKNSTGNALEISELLYQTGLFATVQPDFLAKIELTCTNDPLFPNQWGAENTGQNGDTPNIDINLCQAQQISTGSGCVVVAVVDGGVDKTHPDLINNIFSESFNVGTGTSPSQTTGTDANHGTMVAGIIGSSRNNGIGITGVAPDSPIMSISKPLANITQIPNGISKLANGVSFAWQNGARSSIIHGE